MLCKRHHTHLLFPSSGPVIPQNRPCCSYCAAEARENTSPVDWRVFVRNISVPMNFDQIQGCVSAGWLAVCPQSHEHSFFSHYVGHLLGLSRIRSFNCCILSGSGLDGPHGAAPELGILEDGYLPALGNELQDLPQNWVR